MGFCVDCWTSRAKFNPSNQGRQHFSLRSKNRRIALIEHLISLDGTGFGTSGAFRADNSDENKYRGGTKSGGSAK